MPYADPLRDADGGLTAPCARRRMQFLLWERPADASQIPLHCAAIRCQVVAGCSEEQQPASSARAAPYGAN